MISQKIDATSNPKIMGGMFGLEINFQPDLPSLAVPPILAGPHLRLATARSAFTLLARTLRPPTVWLPSYLCGVVLEAFKDVGTCVKFYPVGEQLKITDEAWINSVESQDMVVFIDYFGFNMWNFYGKAVKKRGAWVVEDACQAMLNLSFSENADYVIASPRKFLGVPDGGILLAQNEAKLPSVDLPPPPGEWWIDSLKASHLRASFDSHGGDREWFELFRKTDPNGPVEPTRMSELSSQLLDHAFNYSSISVARRRNFEQLALELPEFAIFNELSANVSPLGFPVSVCDRDRLRLGLFKHDIFPPIHWNLCGIVPKKFEASHYLEKRIMTLPCDQRYSPEDISFMIQIFRSFHPVPFD
jgi:hypothetical protein